MARALAKRGHKVEIWIPGFDHSKHKFFIQQSKCVKVEKNISIQYLKSLGYSKDVSLKRYVHNLQLAQEFKKIAEQRETKPDCIITQVPSLELAGISIKFAKQHNLTSFLDIRDLYPDNYQRLLPRPFRLLYPLLFCQTIKKAKKIITEADSVFTISRTFERWASHMAEKGALRSFIFPLGYEKIPFPPKFDKNKIFKRHSIPPGKKYIIFAGTFCQSYDLRFLPLAAAWIKKKYKNTFHFILAGNGEISKKFMLKCKTINNITFTGWLNDVELSVLLEKAFVGMAPYSANAKMSLPNKFFEYATYQIPILCSLQGEMKDLFQKNDCGVFFKPGDPTSFVLGLEKILGKYSKMRRHCKKMLHKKFSVKKIYEDFSKRIEKEIKYHESRSTA